LDQDDRIVQEEELSASDGQEGRPAFVAHKGKVYDVSGSRLWRTGVHVRRHHAGQDLTADLAAAPHDESVFERVPMVGELAAEAEEPEGEPALSRAEGLTALLDWYFDLHPHPVAVHFPVALGVVTAVFLILYLLTGNTAFQTQRLLCPLGGSRYDTARHVEWGRELVVQLWAYLRRAFQGQDQPVHRPAHSGGSCPGPADSKPLIAGKP
jgi:predicted heme/steroid binding protein